MITAREGSFAYFFKRRTEVGPDKGTAREGVFTDFTDIYKVEFLKACLTDTILIIVFIVIVIVQPSRTESGLTDFLKAFRESDVIKRPIAPEAFFPIVRNCLGRYTFSSLRQPSKV